MTSPNSTLCGVPDIRSETLVRDLRVLNMAIAHMEARLGLMVAEIETEVRQARRSATELIGKIWSPPISSSMQHLIR
jgi:hypothetical protein